jgi:hypothetical protein
MKKVLIALGFLGLVGIGVCDVAISQTKKTSPQVKPQAKVQKILTNDEKAQLFTQSYLMISLTVKLAIPIFAKMETKLDFSRQEATKFFLRKFMTKAKLKTLKTPN